MGGPRKIALEGLECNIESIYRLDSYTATYRRWFALLQSSLSIVRFHLFLFSEPQLLSTQIPTSGLSTGLATMGRFFGTSFP